MFGMHSFTSALNSEFVEEQDCDIAALHDLGATPFLDVETDGLEDFPEFDDFGAEDFSSNFADVLAAPLVTAPPAPVCTTPPAPVCTTPFAPVCTTPPAPVCTTPFAPVCTTPPAPVCTTPFAPVCTTPPAPVCTTPFAPVCTTPPAPVPELYWPTKQIYVEDDKLVKSLSSRLDSMESSMSPAAREKHKGWAAKKRKRVRYGRKHVYANKSSVAKNRHRGDGKFETKEMRINRLTEKRAASIPRRQNNLI